MLLSISITACGGSQGVADTTDVTDTTDAAVSAEAADRLEDGARPELSTHIENPEQYDTIILGYPNWWSDIPMPVYTFLEKYDFSGKKIIPFVTHGGSRFSDTERTIAELQPGARVSEEGLSLSRNDVVDSADKVIEWAQHLDLN